MKTTCLLRVKELAICHEILDGEVVAVSFETGNYYSMTGTAARIWPLLATGASIDRICAHLGARDAAAREGVARFAEGLIAEGLVEETDAESPAQLAPAGDTAPAEFAPPAFEKFADMQDLLLADPLHEVDAAGWPHRKADPAA